MSSGRRLTISLLALDLLFLGVAGGSARGVDAAPQAQAALVVPAVNAVVGENGISHHLSGRNVGQGDVPAPAIAQANLRCSRTHRYPGLFSEAEICTDPDSYPRGDSCPTRWTLK
jgi:hypothetical protein